MMTIHRVRISSRTYRGNQNSWNTEQYGKGERQCGSHGGTSHHDPGRPGQRDTSADEPTLHRLDHGARQEEKIKHTGLSTAWQEHRDNFQESQTRISIRTNMERR